MKMLYYDAEGDILTVDFLPTSAKRVVVKKEAGIEIANNVVFYFDPVDEKPVQMILISYNRLVEHTRRSPLQLKKLTRFPKRLQRLTLKLIQQPPVSNFLEVKTSDKNSHLAVRVKKLIIEPKLLEAA